MPELEGESWNRALRVLEQDARTRRTLRALAGAPRTLRTLRICGQNVLNSTLNMTYENFLEQVNLAEQLISIVILAYQLV